MRSPTARRLAVAGSVLALTGGLAACGTGSSSSSSGGTSSTGGGGNGQIQAGPGVDTKSKTISLGVLSPLSGPVAVIGKPLTAGNETYFKALDASGGIDGWKIKLVERDTKYDPQQQVQQYNAIANQVAMIGQSLGSPTTQAIQQLADSQDMLVGAAAQDSAFTTDPHMAVIGTPYAVDVANGLHYVVQHKGKNVKVGIIYQNDAYGQDGVRGYEAALKADGFKDVARASYKVGDTDLTAQVQKMKSAGAQYVVVTAVPTTAATIVGTGASQGYNPQWIFQGPAWSEYLMTSDGTQSGKETPVYKALAATVWVLGYEPTWGDKSVPGMKQFLADTKKFAPKQIPDYYYMYGYAQAKMEADVLRKAIQSGDLTRKGILNAKLHAGTIDFGGLLPTATYTPSLGPADRKTEIAKVDPSKPGFLKTFVPFFTSTAAQNLKFQKSGG